MSTITTLCNAPFAMLKSILEKAIQARGPLTIASYMKQCLTHPEYGYYVKQDPFGAKGDFITSPEISQMFGELVGINILTQWMSQGQPSKIRLIEMGPGRGTLMDDLLRAAKTFPPFFKAIDSIEFLEAGTELRNIQKQRLSKYSKPIQWFDVMKEIPVKSNPSYIIAHEFFDALPIHQYEKTEQGWRERVVDSIDGKLKPMLAPFEPMTNQTIAAQPRFERLPLLSQIEICPEGWEIAKQVGEILKASTGGALIMDYGPLQTIPTNTFRAFKNHKQVDPFEHPGDADLTADVDFVALKSVFSQQHLHVEGPIKQADWLHAMGIGARATVLHNEQNTEEGKTRIEQAYKRLVDPVTMGKTYKVMAVSSSAGQIAGF